MTKAAALSLLRPWLRVQGLAGMRFKLTKSRKPGEWGYELYQPGDYRAVWWGWVAGGKVEGPFEVRRQGDCQ